MEDSHLTYKLIRMEGEGNKMEGLSVLVDTQNRHRETKKEERLKENEKIGLSDAFSSLLNWKAN